MKTIYSVSMVATTLAVLAVGFVRLLDAQEAVIGGPVRPRRTGDTADSDSDARLASAWGGAAPTAAVVRFPSRHRTPPIPDGLVRSMR
jgi:hypothetical protein